MPRRSAGFSDNPNSAKGAASANMIGTSVMVRLPIFNLRITPHCPVIVCPDTLIIVAVPEKRPFCLRVRRLSKAAFPTLYSVPVSRMTFTRCPSA